ncbi:MAG: 3-oxoacyl-ACP reductase FabG [Deltaproteobacteria bacterium]|nr:3-oxoacyl-ACP reductase FabG [Deltaproteobacteria bacterium]
MGNLSGRIALVTGGSRGIGRACALALSRAGADVAVNYKEREKEARLTADRVLEIGRRTVAIQADVSLSQEVVRLIGVVERELGGIDILVNNAGLSRPRNIDSVTEADWDETIAVNLKSVFLMTQAVLPGMRARGWGRIVNITSGAAHTGGIVGPHYTASKAGMEGLTRAYAARLVKEGITVNSVAPSIIATDMIGGDRDLSKRIPMGRMGQADEVADAVVFAVGNAYLTGQTIPLNGGSYFR